MTVLVVTTSARLRKKGNALRQQQQDLQDKTLKLRAWTYHQRVMVVLCSHHLALKVTP